MSPRFGGPYGGSPAFGNHSLPMNYSDGLQASGGDGQPTDDERDADGDGLGNFDEIRGLMAQGTYSTGPAAECYEYKPRLPRNFASVDYLEADTDGDGILDGNDDQDNDGVSNVDEIKPDYFPCGDSGPLPVYDAPPPDDGPMTRLNPYNPCQPNRSSGTCARYGGE